MINFKHYKSILLIGLFTLSCFSIGAQVNFISDEVSEGYTLFTRGNNQAYLINNCGEVINTWFGVNPNYHAKLLPNGNLVYIDGYQNQIIEKNWDNNIVKSISLQEAGLSLAYEVIVLPSGNYLCLARKFYGQADMVALGYNPDETDPYQFDAIVELDSDTGETVWFWNTADHVIQERDSTAANYGSVSDNPQLLDMDAIYDDDVGVSWAISETFLINGMDYNPELDQIIVSLRKMNEIAIIDHSTTREEAAGSTGGNSNMGGDFIYRWGNPKNYGAGTEDDRYLYFQHNPNWIKDGPDKGKLTFFNNGIYRPGPEQYSTVGVIDPPRDGYNYSRLEGTAFEPALPEYDISKVTSGTDFYSNYTSASRFLPNGNIMITIGDRLKVIEVNRAGEIVWDYDLVSAFFTFRAEKYNLDYPAFEGKELFPGNTVSGIPNNVPCQLQTDTEELYEDFLKFTYDPISRSIDVVNSEGKELRVSIYNAQGKLVSSEKSNSNFQAQVTNWTSGIYFIRIQNKEKQIQLEKIFID